MKLYYVEEIELINLDDNVTFEKITTGNKLLTLYDIDTQTMDLIIVCEIETTLDKKSIEELSFWLDNDDYWSEQNYELIKL